MHRAVITNRRVYEITLRDSQKKERIVGQWRTTCSLAAMTFVHSFGKDAGFGLFSHTLPTCEIPNVQQIVNPS